MSALQIAWDFLVLRFAKVGTRACRRSYRVLAVVLLICVTCAQKVTATAPRATTVCEVLKRLRTLDGKTVAVRGEWVYGMEQNHLKDKGCSLNLMINGQSWPEAIYLNFDHYSQLRELEQSVDAKVGHKWGSPRREGHNVRVIVTFVGQLNIVQSGSSGFGHLDGFVAQLDVTSAYRLVVSRQRREH